MEKLQKSVEEFNKEHKKKDDYSLSIEHCRGFFENISNQTSDEAIFSVNELYNYGFMNGYNQCYSENKNNEFNIIMEFGECVDLLRFLNDNLHCVRFSIAEEIVADNRVIDNALYNVNLSLEKIIGDFDKLLDK